MAAQKGLEMLLKVDSDGAGTYQTLAGLQSVTFTLDKETVEITSQDDTSRYRQLLAGAGVKSLRFTGNGVFKDAAADATVRSYWAADTIRNFQIIIPSFYSITCFCSVTNVEYSGQHNGEAQYSISLDSAGDPTFAAI
jgi:TP901-1 family phage major tail protein